MSKNHFGTTIIALFAILLTMFVSSCKGNAVNVYYTITYETAYGTAPESKKVLSGTVLTAQDLPELTADGYTFEGWYIDSTKITPELNYTVNYNIKLTAKWSEVTAAPPTPASYTVSYSTDHGQAPQTKTVLSGTALTAADLPDLTAQGYVFEGWYIGTTKITEGYEVSGNITLTAKWEKAFTVTYDSAYGQAPEPITVAYKTELTYEDLPELSDADHEFEGWYFGSKEVLPGYKVYTDMTLTAYWDGNEPEEVKYTVSYTSKFGHEPPSRQFVAGETLTGGDLLTMYEEGYTFEGWYFGNIKMERYYPVMQDMVLVAKWICTTPNLDFLISAGSGATQSEANFEVSAVKSDSNYIITATPGFDMYFWSVDEVEDSDYLLFYDEIRYMFSSPSLPTVVTQNTLTFNEQLLPDEVTPDGTYRVYCQAIKIIYNDAGQASDFERAGLDFVVVKM